ncbi:hypothetical protein PCL_08199 [Purpureocillium lilacinum]|uniref:Uncharacterized protein n=1 Tax=Purpureocillium lilacinum TaxID=33203 RepID=A0A2U3EK29_PURLI|nr:hypothetical protein PCL_08199 [Purpureocillium lilacinum]
MTAPAPKIVTPNEHRNVIHGIHPAQTPSYGNLHQLSRLPLFIGGGDLDLLSLYCLLRFAGTGLGVNEGFRAGASRESDRSLGRRRGGVGLLDGLREPPRPFRGGGE